MIFSLSTSAASPSVFLGLTSLPLHSLFSAFDLLYPAFYGYDPSVRIIKTQKEITLPLERLILQGLLQFCRTCKRGGKRPYMETTTTNSSIPIIDGMKAIHLTDDAYPTYLEFITMSSGKVNGTGFGGRKFAIIHSHYLR